MKDIKVINALVEKCAAGLEEQLEGPEVEGYIVAAGSIGDQDAARIARSMHGSGQAMLGILAIVLRDLFEMVDPEDRDGFWDVALQVFRIALEVDDDEDP